MTRGEQPAGSTEEVLTLFHHFADDRYDEDVTQLDHALQTAALASAEGAADELVLAALLHDVGHLLSLRDGSSTRGTDADSALSVGDRPGDRPDLQHEARGARWLAALFPPAVTGPIALHVAAKRFICATEPDHLAVLSAGSRVSLARQGGPMDANEIIRFRAMPAHADAVRLRRWDDAGKQTEGIEVAALASYRPRLERWARLGARP